MKNKILSALLCIVLVIVLTGCGSKSNDNTNNSNKDSNVVSSDKSDDVSNWDKSRKGDSLNNSDKQKEDIIYRVERMEDGNYILFYKYTKSEGINLFAEMRFFDSSSGTKKTSGTRLENLLVAGNTTGAIMFKDIENEYDSYEIEFPSITKFDIKKYDNIKFKESKKDDKLKIETIIDSKYECSGLDVTVVFYKDDKIVTAIEENNGYGNLIIVKDYPKDKNGNNIEYDRYEIYLNSIRLSEV